jgi:hypothetical protein
MAERFDIYINALDLGRQFNVSKEIANLAYYFCLWANDWEVGVNILI